jgi:hypothetical protein
MKLSMGMDVAPDPNPSDIRISMDIQGFTHYVHHHNYIGAFRHFGNILAIIIWTMEGRGSGKYGRGLLDCLVGLVGSK